MNESIKNLSNIVGKYVPALANAILPGSGSLMSLIAQEFGADVHNTDSIASKISLDPNANEKLLEIYSNCKIEIQKINAMLATEEMKDYTQDIANARDMKKETHSYMPEALTCMIVLGFIALVYTMLHVVLPQENKDILNIMIGAITASVTQAVAFWLGSSRSSAMKDNFMYGGKK